MARYRISHDLDRTYVCRDDNGNFFWGDYEVSELFPNYKTAKQAIETMPVEKRMYGFDYKPRFIKFYDNEEHRRKEAAYLENKRILRDFGH